jgi:hypothetical protein
MFEYVPTGVGAAIVTVANPEEAACGEVAVTVIDGGVGAE